MSFFTKKVVEGADKEYSFLSNVGQEGGVQENEEQPGMFGIVFGQDNDQKENTEK